MIIRRLYGWVWLGQLRAELDEPSASLQVLPDGGASFVGQAAETAVVLRLQRASQCPMQAQRSRLGQLLVTGTIPTAAPVPAA